MRPEVVMQILGRFHADFMHNGLRNLRGTVADLFRNRTGMVPQASLNLSRSYPGWTPCGLKISCRFHAEWVAVSQRNRNRIVPESFRNPSASLAQSIYALSSLDSMQPEDFMQILRRFHAEFMQNGLRNLS